MNDDILERDEIGNILYSDDRFVIDIRISDRDYYLIILDHFKLRCILDIVEPKYLWVKQHLDQHEISIIMSVLNGNIFRHVKEGVMINGKLEFINLDGSNLWETMTNYVRYILGDNVYIPDRTPDYTKLLDQSI